MRHLSRNGSVFGEYLQIFREFAMFTNAKLRAMFWIGVRREAPRCAVIIWLTIAAIPAADEASAACKVDEPSSPASGDSNDADGDNVADHSAECSVILPGSSDIDLNGCPMAIDPFVELNFDDALHRGWYNRFWTGTCDELSGGARAQCGLAKIFNSTYWLETVSLAVHKLSEEDSPSTRFQLWRLGRLIGHEWARANDVQRIDTDDIADWGERIVAASPDELCGEIRALFETANSALR